MPNAIATRGEAVGRTSIIARVEARRRSGALAEARQAAEGALSKNPYDADLHDALARVLSDAGELQLACDAWETARRIMPGHVGALKGLGFLAYRRGDRHVAQRLLDEACRRSPSDIGLRGALQRMAGIPPVAAPAAPPMRPHESASPGLGNAPERTVEHALLRRADANDSFVLLCDLDGLVMAGTLGGADGVDLRAQVACDVSALVTAIDRACQHLGLGEWTTCLLEGEDEARGIGRVGTAALVLSEARGEGAAGRVLARVHEDAGRAATQLRPGR
jgi:tetratricopeptide (TPR) repeat protein